LSICRFEILRGALGRRRDARRFLATVHCPLFTVVIRRLLPAACCWLDTELKLRATTVNLQLFKHRRLVEQHVEVVERQEEFRRRRSGEAAGGSVGVARGQLLQRLLGTRPHIFRLADEHERPLDVVEEGGSAIRAWRQEGARGWGLGACGQRRLVPRPSSLVPFLAVLVRVDVVAVLVLPGPGEVGVLLPR
jgi:hypothetical protein